MSLATQHRTPPVDPFFSVSFRESSELPLAMQPLIRPQFQTAPTSMLLSHQRHRGTEDMSTHSDAWTPQDTNCLGLPLYNPCSVLGEPQNHRMAEVGGDPWRSSGPTPWFKQGHVKPATRNYVQTAFQYLQRGSIHKLSGQVVPELSSSQ